MRNTAPMNAAALRIAVIVTLAALAAQAQQPLKFEVASIRPADPAAPSLGRAAAGSNIYENRNAPLRLLIVIAYDTLDYQLIVPDWLSREASRTDQKFDIRATIPAGATRADIPQLMQNLLAERFGLRVHREKRPMDAYEVVPAKGGHKMKRVAPDTKNAFAYLPDGMTRYTGDPYVWIQGIVATKADRPVVLSPELQGKYEMLINVGAGRPEPAAPGVEPLPRDPASIIADMLEPSGLKIERKRVPVDVVVVDHCEKMPTEN